MTNAIINSGILLLRPLASFRMEHVPSFSSYPKAPENKGPFSNCFFVNATYNRYIVDSTYPTL